MSRQPEVIGSRVDRNIPVSQDSSFFHKCHKYTYETCLLEVYWVGVYIYMIYDIMCINMYIFVNICKF